MAPRTQHRPPPAPAQDQRRRPINLARARVAMPLMAATPIGIFIADLMFALSMPVAVVALLGWCALCVQLDRWAHRHPDDRRYQVPRGLC